GADVMRITAPHLPGFPLLDTDTGRGKLSAALDLRAEEEAARLAGTLRTARRGGARSAGRTAARGACVRAGLSARRHRVIRILARGMRGDQTRHRGREAVCIRDPAALDGAPWLRLAGAERLRYQSCRGGGSRHRCGPQGTARSGP